MYVVTLSVGILVGLIYGFLNVRSPAPPVIALIGLLGILAGEQAVPWLREWMAGKPVSVSTVKSDCAAQMFAPLPRADQAPAAARTPSTPHRG